MEYPRHKHGWVGVDFDGTLAEYTEWLGPRHVGKPIPAMVERVKAWLKAGYRVKIFTARVMVSPTRDSKIARKAIEDFCFEHIGQILEVTCIKDYHMTELWDDRSVTVRTNTGDCFRFGEQNEEGT